ncbi:MAG TPA: hypothetical protein VEY70_08765 [Metabacillus sp.]|nr:hypothetical protein [Metabacillus sp.]
MKLNTDIHIFKDNKNKMTKIKQTQNKTYAQQTKEILFFYMNLPVEDLANLIINRYKLNELFEKSTITIRTSFIKEELIHLHKVYKALLTKLPDLKFSQLLLYLFEDYFKRHT